MWAYNFVMDCTQDGRPLKMLTVVDEYTRECLVIAVRRRLTSREVQGVLSELFLHRGAPRAITVDNGSEFASRIMDALTYRHGIQLDFIRPGKPVENFFI